MSSPEPRVLDEIEAFTAWWLTNRVIKPPLEGNSGLNHIGPTHAVVLYREGPFQVELLSVKPDAKLPPHRHPNIDSIEIYMSGDIAFTCGDKENYTSELRIPPNELHSAESGPRGGCALSFQHWLNGVPPTFVGDDWVDDTNNPSYAAFVAAQGSGAEE